MTVSRRRTWYVLVIAVALFATTTPSVPPRAGMRVPEAAPAGAGSPGDARSSAWRVPTVTDLRRWTVVATSVGDRVTTGAVEPTSVVGTPAKVAAAVARRRVRAAPPRREFTVAVTGDILLHGPVVAAARRSDGTYHFTPLLKGIRRTIASADLALCHLEVPLSRKPSALSGYPVFNAPAQVADALAAVGYDGCSVASNHALDQGIGGIRATLRALERAGLRHAGTARSRREHRRVTMYSVADARVAHLSYTYGLNGFTPPADRRWAVNLIDARKIVTEARRAHRRGADLVLVSLHWGTEYVTAPTADQRRLAGRLLRSPAIDALIGHHAHVVQPVRRRHGKIVVFGLGNLLSNQSAACCPAATQDGVIVRLRVRERRGGRLAVVGAEYLPTFVRHPQRRVVLVDQELRDGAKGAWAEQLRASRRRTRRAIGDVATPVR